MDWKPDGDFEDIRYETAEGIAKITINRPEVRNAFRPKTLFELSRAFDVARRSARAATSVCAATMATRTRRGSAA